MVLAMSGQGSILQVPTGSIRVFGELQVQSKRIVHSQICLPNMSHAALWLEICWTMQTPRYQYSRLQDVCMFPSHEAFFSHGLAGIDCMAFISGECSCSASVSLALRHLLLGRLRCDQKMHVRTVELPQPPRRPARNGTWNGLRVFRIAYHSSGICVVGCCDAAMTLTSLSQQSSCSLFCARPIPSRSRAQLQFVDSETTHLLDSMTLGQAEPCLQTCRWLRLTYSLQK